MTRNEIFAVAVDWLYTQGKIADQAELARKTGITETTISRILNNKVRKPSDETLRRLNEAFDNVFNYRWLRGESDEMFANKATIEKIKDINPKDLMAGVENLLQIATTQIKDNKELRRELRESIQELHNIISTLKAPASKQYELPTPTVLKVAEPEDKLKK